MSITVSDCSIRENFRSPVTQANGDIIFGDLIFMRQHNPDGMAEKTKDGVRLTIRKNSYPLDTEDAKENQRAELLEVQKQYLKPGQPVSYSWRMRASGDVPKNKNRFMVAQFKSLYGDNESPSPLFALRVENGQYFATIEQSYGAGYKKAIPAKNGLCTEGSPATERVEGGDQLTVLFAKDEKGFATKKWSKLCAPETRVENFNPLPKLNEKWVDFKLNIQAGPKGRIEFYANGKLVARAAGPFGDLKSDVVYNKQYFKLGPYRDREDATASLEYANFYRTCDVKWAEK
ncbi:MAG: heparin lyase I family protein [Pseudomonadota bacterium]